MVTSHSKGIRLPLSLSPENGESVIKSEKEAE